MVEVELLLVDVSDQVANDPDGEQFNQLIETVLSDCIAANDILPKESCLTNTCPRFFKSKHHTPLTCRQQPATLKGSMHMGQLPTGVSFAGRCDHWFKQ